METLTVIIVILTVILVIIGILGLIGMRDIIAFLRTKKGKITVEVIKGIVKIPIGIGIALSTSYAIKQTANLIEEAKWPVFYIIYVTEAIVLVGWVISTTCKRIKHIS